MKPSDFVKRQVRVTPYPHEDVGWIIARVPDDADPAVLVRLPARRRRSQSAEALQRQSLAGASARERLNRFYCDNFIDLMGAGLAPDLRRPKSLAAA